MIWPFSQLNRIEDKLDFLIEQGGFTVSVLDDLTAAVQQTTDVEASAIVLIEGIAKQLADAIAANDPAALLALKDKLTTEAAALAAAVAANTTPAP